MTQSSLSLPIDDVIDNIKTSLRTHSRLVLAAPPGAGKTTRVPLALLDEDWAKSGKILVLEPRRIAARAAATRMAQTLGERVGDTIGLRARLDVRTSKSTRIEVITEGIFTRMILDDPELSGISAVIFDEFHERSLDADLGLALALEAQEALREDLRILPMSATLDTQGLPAFLNAPLIQSDGRAHPVTTHYIGRNQNARLEDEVASAINHALKEETGSLLVFLPGAMEIKRTAERLDHLGDNILIAPLFGGLTPQEQDAAISPPPAGKRKIVLATDIAESSLTIEGVRIVIDAGLARVPRYDASLNASRLDTIRASRANADQRRGRAGRTEPGVCYRLWHEAETRGLPAFPAPEITNSDLTSLVLDLARWGTHDPSSMRWLDAPPQGVWNASLALLQNLGAINEKGQPTPFGLKLSDLPLPPRLAAMVLGADKIETIPLAAHIAALISERGLSGKSIDARERLARFSVDKSGRARAMRDMANRWARTAKPALKNNPYLNREEAGVTIAQGFPDRIAKARPGKVGEFLMANGRAAQVDTTDPLSREAWLAIADITGGAATLRITLAAPISEAEARDIGPEITEDIASFDAKLNRLTARRVTRIGAITLSQTPLAKPSGKAAIKGLLDAFEKDGTKLLPAHDAIASFSARINFLHTQFGSIWPENFANTIHTRAKDWLAPLLENARDFSNITDAKAIAAIKTLLDWQLISEMENLAPSHWTTPTDRNVSIVYDSEKGPTVSVKAQEFFGLSQHPHIANGRVPLTLEMLSPAQRPIAMTKDIVAFWTGGYQDMRKDMRGRYPKHDWPENPANAKPQRGVKKRSH
ncbi:ATP-dependent helicase HrpB [Hirschia litorea]|uniref:ATP-dependent helicase HrpB n=1 Tax=Hirschia litorea TaxID=1199156 RepID=A0ABW2IMJ6_9PROT